MPGTASSSQKLSNHRPGASAANISRTSNDFGDPVAAEYLSAVQVVFSDSDRIETALADYIWTLAQVAARKYMFINWSIRALVLAFVFGVSALVLS
jgi:hypothetical protein